MRPENDEYQLMFAVPPRIGAPFGYVGVQCNEDVVFGVRYLPESMRELPPQNHLAREVAKQLRAYFKKPRAHKFDLPLRPAPTIPQRKVREILMTIPAGEVKTYNEVAKLIKSGPRGVGSVCRANCVGIVVPCHRVVAANGIGGYAGGVAETLDTKRWFLKHEGAKCKMTN